MTLTRSLGNCQLILISLTGILIIGWILTNENSQENSSKKKSYLQYLTLSVQTNFRSLSGQLFNTTLLPLKRIHLHGQRHITTSGFANAEKRLFGTGNYSFYIRTIRGISGNHQIWCTDTKGPKDFLLNKQSLESNYDSHLYLLRGQGFLWYTVLKRAQIHANTLYICSKIAYLSYHQELQQ